MLITLKHIYKNSWEACEKIAYGEIHLFNAFTYVDIWDNSNVYQQQMLLK